MNENPRAPTGPDPLLDLPALVGGGRVSSPDLRLRRAVLEDALRLVLGEEPAGRRVRAEAERWIFSNDRTWPLSFRNVCRTLLVDPVEVRRRVLAHGGTAGDLRPAA